MKQRQRQTIFEKLVRDHSTELFRFALWQTGSSEDAEDLTQEAYYEAWRSIDSLRSPASGRAWIFQILRHRYAHWTRTRRRRPDTMGNLEGIEERGYGSKIDIDGPFERQDTLNRAFAKIDERYREPFLLVFLEGFTCREAAALLEVPLGTVLSRIHRARKALRTLISGFELRPDGELPSPRLELVRKKASHDG